MATLSDYTSGTISLANGSVTVTGTGTLFEVTRFREGDTLQIQNLTAVIASVDSDTQLTLAEPWTGESIVNGAYRARQLGDGSRVSTQAATVIELLGNGVLTNLAELGVEEGKVPVGGPTGEYELADLVQDPNGSLGELAELTDVDNITSLAALALAANKILNTDGSGDLTQSDITAAALVLLKLAGTAAANKFPYFDDADSAALADLTTQARTMLASPTPAITSLGYTPVNKAGDTFSGPLTFDGFNNTGNIRQWNSVTLANNGLLSISQSGLLIINEFAVGGVGLFILGGNGGGSVTSLSPAARFGTALGTSGRINVFAYPNPSMHYEVKNETGSPAQINVFLISTRNGV